MYIYRFLNYSDEVIYIGITENIFRRLEQQHFTNIGHLPLECYTSTKVVEYIEYEDLSFFEAEIIEYLLVEKYKPIYNSDYNKNMGDIRNSKFITLNEEYLVERWMTYKEMNVEEVIKNTYKKKLKEEGNVDKLRITEEEYNKIISYLDEIKDYRTKALITIAYNSNFRVSEIIKLTIDNYKSIDVEVKGKFSLKSSTLPDVAIKAIEEYLQYRVPRDTNALFTSKTGRSGAINRVTVGTNVRKVFEELNLDMTKASIDSIRNRQIL